MGLDIAEIPDAPRRRNLSFFLVALALVIPLRSIAPLSWAFVLHALYARSLSSFEWKGHLLFAFALSEVCRLRPTKHLSALTIMQGLV